MMHFSSTVPAVQIVCVCLTLSRHRYRNCFGCESCDHHIVEYRYEIWASCLQDCIASKTLYSQEIDSPNPSMVMATRERTMMTTSSSGYLTKNCLRRRMRMMKKGQTRSASRRANLEKTTRSSRIPSCPPLPAHGGRCKSSRSPRRSKLPDSTFRSQTLVSSP